MNLLEIKNLTVAVEGKQVLQDISLSIAKGEIHALMGPNGSGKTSLAFTIFGHPSYKAVSGQVFFKGKDILDLKTEERSRLGLYLSFQEPPEIGGISTDMFLQTISREDLDGGRIEEALAKIGLEESFLHRFLNDGFSGGEKKKSEILQLIALKPSFAIIDEVDSGLDLDSLKAIADILKDEVEKGLTVLIISHSPRFFQILVPDKVHVLNQGQLVVSGRGDILEALEKDGYKNF